MAKKQFADWNGLNTLRRFVSKTSNYAEKQFADWHGLNTLRRFVAKPEPRHLTRTRVVLWDYPRFRYTIDMQYGDETSRRFVVFGLKGNHILEAKYKVVLSTLTVLSGDGIIDGSHIDVDLYNLPRGAMWLDLMYRTENEVKNTRWAVIVT